MSQRLLGDGQHRSLAAGLRIDDTVGRQPRLCQSGREEVAAAQRPQDRTVARSHGMRNEEHRSRSVRRVRTARPDFVHARREAASGHVPVHRFYAEPKRGGAGGHARRQAGAQVF